MMIDATGDQAHDIFTLTVDLTIGWNSENPLPPYHIINDDIWHYTLEDKV